MKKVVTLTGKNLPRLSVAKPGWPNPIGYFHPDSVISREQWLNEKAISDFTRVCDQTGLSERLRKD